MVQETLPPFSDWTDQMGRILAGRTVMLWRYMKHYIFQLRRLVNRKVLLVLVLVIVFLSLIIALLLLLGHKNDGKRLELVQVLFRHGERTPGKDDYSKLPYVPTSVYEPYGLGHLTNEGMMHSYELGSVLRKRYANYLHDVYHAEDLYAHASDHERTRATLQLVLAGLYPPIKEFQWNPVLNWQPIPYIYTPAKFDVLFKPILSKRYIEIQMRETAGLILAKINEEYSDFVQHLEDFSNLPVNERLIVLCNVYHVLSINERMGILLPKWYTPDVLVRLKDFLMFFLDCLTYTPEMKRLIGGPLTKKFVDNMNVDQILHNPRKMYLYSGHEFNIAAVLRALGVVDFGYPDYSSAIIIEKLRNVYSNRLYVKLLGRRGSKEEFKILKMANCSELCPMEEFLMITNEVIPSDEEMHLMEKDFLGSLTDDLFLNDPYVKKL